MAPGRMHSNHLLSVGSKKMLFHVRSWNGRSRTGKKQCLVFEFTLLKM